MAASTLQAKLPWALTLNTRPMPSRGVQRSTSVNATAAPTTTIGGTVENDEMTALDAMKLRLTVNGDVVRLRFALGSR